MAEKKEKPISIRLTPKALARLDKLADELDMNRTSVIQEALKALERETDAQHRPNTSNLKVVEGDANAQ